MAFSQFLLIWYANIPDETQFYRHRMPGTWLYISLSLPFLRFFIPFFTLISRPAKRNLKLLGVMAAYSLVVVYLDLYWVVMPILLSQRSADSLAGFCHPGSDGEHRWTGVLEPVPQARDGSGGRSCAWSRACTLRMHKS